MAEFDPRLGEIDTQQTMPTKVVDNSVAEAITDIAGAGYEVFRGYATEKARQSIHDASDSISTEIDANMQQSLGTTEGSAFDEAFLSLDEQDREMFIKHKSFKEYVVALQRIKRGSAQGNISSASAELRIKSAAQKMKRKYPGFLAEISREEQRHLTGDHSQAMLKVQMSAQIAEAEQQSWEELKKEYLTQADKHSIPKTLLTDDPGEFFKRLYTAAASDEVIANKERILKNEELDTATGVYKNAKALSGLATDYYRQTVGKVGAIIGVNLAELTPDKIMKISANDRGRMAAMLLSQKRELENNLAQDYADGTPKGMSMDTVMQKFSASFGIYDDAINALKADDAIAQYANTIRSATTLDTAKLVENPGMVRLMTLGDVVGRYPGPIGWQVMGSLKGYFDDATESVQGKVVPLYFAPDNLPAPGAADVSGRQAADEKLNKPPWLRDTEQLTGPESRVKSGQPTTIREVAAQNNTPVPVVEAYTFDGIAKTKYVLDTLKGMSDKENPNKKQNIADVTNAFAGRNIALLRHFNSEQNTLDRDDYKNMARMMASDDWFEVLQTLPRDQQEAIRAEALVGAQRWGVRLAKGLSDRLSVGVDYTPVDRKVGQNFQPGGFVPGRRSLPGTLKDYLKPEGVLVTESGVFLEPLDEFPDTLSALEVKVLQTRIREVASAYNDSYVELVKYLAHSSGGKDYKANAAKATKLITHMLSNSQ